ncbi:MAG TPA: fatty acid--CoA ligase, partial [Acetobacteraceae bacterium]|nr:fatty acid--CoA ligase [Acetobacteraceae bacterium]
LLTHKAVAEVAVIGVEDARWGERPIAVVVARPGALVSEDELKAIVKARADIGEISKFAIPDRIVFTEALEKTSVGKLDKKAMRLRYATAPAA